MKDREHLPDWPRGLSRKLAASYVGVSVSLFDEMVRDGRMPRPIRINSRVVWDVRAVDHAFGRLGGEPVPRSATRPLRRGLSLEDVLDAEDAEEARNPPRANARKRPARG